MRIRFASALIAVATGTVVAVGLSLSAATTAGQARAYRPPRAADGKPDLNGVWQAVNTANYDIQAHAARPALALRPGFLSISHLPQTAPESTLSLIGALAARKIGRSRILLA